MTTATLLRAADLPNRPGCLVRRRPGARVHAFRGRLTPQGRTRKGHRPLCGSSGGPWRSAGVATHGLDRVCRRCAAWARRTHPEDLAPRLRELTVDDILASLHAAVSVDEVEAVAFAVIASRRFTELVTDPRTGLTAKLPRHVQVHRAQQRAAAFTRQAIATWAQRNGVDPTDLPYLSPADFTFGHAKGARGPELIALHRPLAAQLEA